MTLYSGLQNLFVTFDTLSAELAAPALYVAMMSAVHLTVPVIVRRRLLLNPAAVFIAIIFFGWIWGIPGALLAVPLLASFKMICERIEHLNPIAAFLTPLTGTLQKPHANPLKEKVSPYGNSSSNLL
jgi:predicted PurR-regulated permease PerM